MTLYVIFCASILFLVVAVGPFLILKDRPIDELVPGRTVSRARPDDTAPRITHAQVLEWLPREIARAFDPANMPCRRSKTGEHDWADHTFYVERFGDATQYRPGGWRCLACEARTSEPPVILS